MGSFIALARPSDVILSKSDKKNHIFFPANIIKGNGYFKCDFTS